MSRLKLPGHLPGRLHESVATAALPLDYHLVNTLQKSLQTTSVSACRRYMLLTSSVSSATSKRCFELTSSVLSTTSKRCFELTSSVLSTTSKQCFEQPAANFLVCSLIFIEYKQANHFWRWKEASRDWLAFWVYFLPDLSIFQKSVTAPREADDTIWAYLPRTPRL